MRRVAISNSRILTVEDDHVTFRYRASDSGQSKLCTVAAEEFIHRFLQHVLPKGFVKVRYYGFLSVAQRAQLTTLCQQLAPSVAVSLSTVPASAMDRSMPRAESVTTTTPPTATDLLNLAPLTPPTSVDLAVSSTVTSSSGTSDQQAAMIMPPSSSSTTPLREVRCPACGRLLLRGSVLFPTRGHPP